MWAKNAIFMFMAMVFFSCNSEAPFEPGAADPFDPFAAGPEVTKERNVTDVDVLFMVDNSGSMDEEQESLKQNFSAFVAHLDNAGLNYKIGVVSSDLGAGSFGVSGCTSSDMGKLQNEPREAGCTPLPDPWIQKMNGVTNVPGDDVIGAFSCLAKLGVGGCGFEQPLEAVYQALLPDVNPGFLRENATLAIVLITDEDDCSAIDSLLFDPNQGANDPLGPLTSFRCFEFGITCHVNGRESGPRFNCMPKSDGYLHPLGRYINQLNAINPHGKVVVSAITGQSAPVTVSQPGADSSVDPSCTNSKLGESYPAIRLKAFVESFGNRGSLHNICHNDFARALDRIGDLVVTTVKTR